MGGRGAGKTRAGAEYIRALALGIPPFAREPHMHIALVGQTMADTRAVMVEGISGLLAVHDDDTRPCFEPSRNLLTWPNGATARLYSAETPDALRRPQFEACWCDASAEAMPPALALMHFDCAVNQGANRAIRFLQQTLNVEADGEIGPITLRAAQMANPSEALKTYAALRENHYESLPHFWRFGRGWLNRLAATRTLAGSLLRTPSEKGPDMTTTAPKWWGESLTIWGTIVTGLSTVLPIIGPFIGLDISAAMIEQLGQTVATLLQALGGVIGTLMAIYGRFRARAPLQQRPISFDF